MQSYNITKQSAQMKKKVNSMSTINYMNEKAVIFPYSLPFPLL
jgi:hypothetical protein